MRLDGCRPPDVGFLQVEQVALSPVLVEQTVESRQWGRRVLAPDLHGQLIVHSSCRVAIIKEGFLGSFWAAGVKGKGGCLIEATCKLVAKM